MLTYETAARAEGRRYVAGIDEAGRGPLAGPVVAAAVVLPEGVSLPGLTDSKLLSEKKREELFPLIHERALGLGCATIDAATIDAINILQATRAAMRNAVLQLPTTPDLLLIDGNCAIEWEGAQKTIVKGDQKSLSIAAASVIAKVTRDRLMREYAAQWPLYGFDRHKGYGSQAHRDAIALHGPIAIHRKSFRGVTEYCRTPVNPQPPLLF